MIKQSIALSGVLAALCLSAGAQVPTGFIAMSSSRLLDQTGTPVPSATVCAQAVVSGNPASVGVGGGGVTTTPSVCVQATNGAWTINVPDGALSSPLNATLAITATDNVSGAPLLAGYGKVQPHSQTCTISAGNVSCVANAAGDWCSSSACNFDLLRPSAPPNVLIYSGPAGPTGPKGDTGASGAASAYISAPDNTVIPPFSPTNIVNQAALQAHRGNFPETIQTLASANIALNRRVFGSLNVVIAAPGYPNFYPSDASITMTHTPKDFTAADVQGMLDLIYARPDGSGNWPSAINSAGAAIQYYSPFIDMNGATTPHPCRPDGDTEWMVPIDELLLYQKTGNIAHFNAHASAIETAEGNIPRDSSTGLVTVANGCWAPWLFQEIVRFDGKTLLPSLFYYRVATAMTTLYTASGSSSDASRWAAIAATIKTSLNASSSLWDNTNGIYNAQDGTATDNKQPDLMGSALAVSLGVATPSQSTAISNYLFAQRGTIFKFGYMIQTYRTAKQNSWGRVGDIASGACFLADHCGAGQYHNGFWSVMDYEVLNTLKLAHADYAVQYALDILSASPQGSVAPSQPQAEYFNQFDSLVGSDVNLESPQGTRLWAEENAGLFAGAGVTKIVSTDAIYSQGYGTSLPDYFGPLNANGTTPGVNINHVHPLMPVRDAWGSQHQVEHDNYNPTTGQNYYQTINWDTGDNTWSFYNPTTGLSRDLFTVRPDGVIFKAPAGNSLTAPTVASGSGVSVSLPSQHPLTDNLFTLVIATGSTAPASGGLLATVTFGTPFTVTVPPAGPEPIWPNCQATYIDAGAPNTPAFAVGLSSTPGLSISIVARDATFAANTTYALNVSCKIF